jgi:acetylornithine deacetylase/succinyl-diaminopimelate desuccinylase-like protein
LERCRNFLRQRSVSATGEGIKETAEMVGAFIKDLGGRVSLEGRPEYPIVYGRLDVGAPRTLIIYGMYDVQPAEEAGWLSPPFEARTRSLPGLGECLIARGAVNSKGALAGVFNTLSTMARVDRPPLNLIFTVEGEEEIGSPSFEQFILDHRDELKAEAAADFDFSQDSRGKVTMHLGLKGIVYLDLTCQGGPGGGPVDSIHGSVSAWVASPVWRLVHALASLTGRRENIKIPGFYENVAGPRRADLTILRRLAETFDEKAFLKEMRSLHFKSGRHGLDLLKRGLYRPVININGLRSGYSGPGTKTILPRRATAKVDIRFGPNMEPEEVVEKFKRHLESNGFGDIQVVVRDFYTWSKTDPASRPVKKMIQAYRLHGLEPEVWPMATWGAPYFVFSRLLKLPVVAGGLGHGGRQHAPSEYMTVKGLLDFEKFVADFLYLMAA